MKERQMIIAGVDEAGRGCLAGPVVAGAVILPYTIPCNIVLADSKILSEKQREASFEWIIEKTTWGVGEASSKEVDAMGIKKATNLAMERAVARLLKTPHKLHIDGNDRFTFSLPFESFIKGDALLKEISAASIIAKVTRDRKMKEYDKEYPEYGFALHKGYGTQYHVSALKKYGACPIHRHTYDPLRTWETQGTLF